MEFARKREDMNRIVYLSLLLLLPLRGMAQVERGSSADDYLRFAPLVSVYVMKGCGVDSRSTWKELLVNSALSVATSSAVAYSLKYTVSSERPDHTDDHGFPSGHATFSFVGATVLHKEYGHLSPWVSVAGYGVATGVGVSRVLRDHHTWWQVASGAAIGVLSTELSYWLGDRLTGRGKQLDLAASPVGLSVAYRF